VAGFRSLLASVEKAGGYYHHHYIFGVKMSLFVLILALEIWPMITLIKWRRAVRAEGEAWRPDERIAATISRISYIEAAIVLLIVLPAVMMARGYGYGGPLRT